MESFPSIDYREDAVKPSLRSKAATAFDLGILNIFSVLAYSLRKKLKWGASFRSFDPQFNDEPFFYLDDKNIKNTSSNELTEVTCLLFGWKRINFTAPPNWNMDYIFNRIFPANSKKGWFEIPDFVEGFDIKSVWELSRFDWSVNLALEGLSDQYQLNQLNSWVRDWVKNNPPFRGLNWKCGQESSLRLLHLSMAALILRNHHSPSSNLIQLCELHLDRILDTLAYAKAQNNNHIISEAAALYVGSSWLFQITKSRKYAQQMEIGAKTLRNSINLLFFKDGTFSQYSTNYHRLALDIISYCEIWRRSLGLSEIKDLPKDRIEKAISWLAHHCEDEGGETVFIGANDGAHFFNGLGVDFKNSGFSVNLAAFLFMNYYYFEDKEPARTMAQLKHLGIHYSPSRKIALSSSFIARDGGFVVLRLSETTIYFRFPEFRFRPSQCDSLSICLWKNGKEVLGDSGSYSYANLAAHRYLTSNSAHNSISYDGQNEMPRISRFLFGNWSKVDHFEFDWISPQQAVIRAKFIFAGKFRHFRQIEFSRTTLKVTDKFDSHSSKREVFWHLPSPGDLLEKRFSNRDLNLHFDTRKAIAVRESSMPKSSYYLHWEKSSVLKVDLKDETEIVSEFEFAF